MLRTLDISNRRKNIVLLGSTGSIGKRVLNVVRNYPKEFRIIALAAGSYSKDLQNQIDEFKPKCVSIADASNIPARKPFGVRFLAGTDGLRELASMPEADLVFIAVVGAVGVHPLLEAIEKNKKIALANKESLVIAGEYISRLKKSPVIIPVDSEHSAIFQCLQGHKKEHINRLIITGSGGALYRKKIHGKNITVASALNHPTWKMGKKITIDSATLMNKGLEVIEAHHLFKVPYDKISVLIHPQSIVHSMVEFLDGSVLAQMSTTDMTFAIQYALTYPSRRPVKINYLQMDKIKILEFEKPDFSRFPCFRLAVEAGRNGGIMPAVMNAANEIAVNAFLAGKISFKRIPEIISATIMKFKNKRFPSVEEILAADAAARTTALEMI